MRTITVTRQLELGASAPAVWTAVRRPETFTFVTRGVLRMPRVARRREPWAAGETVSDRIWLFGVIPLHRHELRFARVDDDAMVLTSHERGGLIRRWDHDIVVTGVAPDRSRYCDRVTIDAGPATLPVAAFAWWFYAYRQRRWRRLATRLARQPGSAAVTSTG